MENYEYEGQNNSVVSVGEWIITILLMIIPLVNIIMLFVWAFGSGTPVSKANWAKASLIWMLISIGLSIIIMVIAGGAIFAGMSGLSGY